jgi:hypothetical protein
MNRSGSCTTEAASIVRYRLAKRLGFAILQAMEWEHKGIRFDITLEALGPFTMAAARVPRVGAYMRVKPFSVVARSEEAALDLLKRQIKFEFRKVPEFSP